MTPALVRRAASRVGGPARAALEALAEELELAESHEDEETAEHIQSCQVDDCERCARVTRYVIDTTTDAERRAIVFAFKARAHCTRRS